MSEPFKFIHAADLHLDTPYSGIAELPNHIRSTLVDAPYVAAERIFDAALAEQVDFLVLSGDVADLDACGPRVFAFLLEQFQRLNAKSIAVYWVGGKADQTDRWPQAVKLPPNVQTFASPMVEEIVHLKVSNQRPAATILAAGFESRPRRISEFRCEPNQPFTIAIAYGELDAEDISKSPVQYWALGGRHQPNRKQSAGKFAVYPGTSQSRTPAESGAFGCLLVQIDSVGTVHTTDLFTDSIRWQKQKISASNDLSKEELKNLFADVGLSIVSDAKEQTVLIQWLLNAPAELNATIRQNGWLEDVTAYLRNEFGQSRPGIWTLSIDTVGNPLPKSLYEEDTILGDFLRNVNQTRNQTAQSLNLHAYYGDNTSDEIMLAAVQMDEERRQAVLDAAAQMGVAHLSGTGELLTK
jgi:DNA repair exonuclease SbcCD nuclease subunit